MVACARCILGLLALLLRTLLDASRARCALLAENALLRHQLSVLQRSIPRPKLTPLERIALVALARVTPAWRNALRLVQPDTLLRWHRAGLRALWRWRSRTARRSPPRRLAQDTITLIRTMAVENRLWGAERIRGELLKLGIQISKRTVQKYMRAARAPAPGGQRWATFLKNHGHEIWACDLLQSYDILFRPIFVFAFIQLATRQAVHVATTRCPCWAWVTQQLRNATPFGSAPRFLLRDRDRKYGPGFDALAKATGIHVIKTAVRVPDMNAICERFLGSLRRECLDHVIVLNDRQFDRVVREYVRFYNEARPHQALRQQTPIPIERPAVGKIVSLPVLGGLHHEYRRAA